MLDPRLQILLGAALFSTGGAAIKACALSSWQVAGLRSAFAAAVLLLLSREARRGWSARAALVAAAYAATLVLFVSATKLTTSAGAIFLQSTAPLYILVLGPLLLRERGGAREIFQLVVLAAGMTLLLRSTEAPQAVAPDPARGDVLAAASGFTYALTLMGMRSLGRGGQSALPPVAIGNLVAAVGCLLIGGLPAAARPLDWALLAYLGVFQIGLAYLLVARGLRQVSALDASLLVLIEPALNPALSWLVHGERVGMGTLLGGALIVGATTVQALGAGRGRPAAA